VLEKLEMVGRLLQFTRQMVLLRVRNEAVEGVAQNFLTGNHRLEP